MRWEQYKNKEKEKWDIYWKEEKGKLSFKKKLTRFIRNNIFSRECAKNINKCFFNKNLILEAGSGSASLTSKIKTNRRKLLAIDLSYHATLFSKNNNVDLSIQGDIFSLPFKNNSIGGIWNAGVMEHFYKEDLGRLLQEFRRVLKKNGKVLFFWPTNKLFMSKILYLLIRFLKKEIVPLAAWEPTKKEILKVLKENNFHNIKIKPSKTLIYYIVKATKGK